MSQVKPRGYFKYILAADCETSGLASRCDDPSYNPETKEEYQSLSWGFLVLDADTLKEVDRLYIEIKYDGESEWDPRAAAIHGLTLKHLEENGIEQEEAVVKIASLVMKYWGPESPICFLAHNAMFDKCFLQRLMRKYEIELRFANRMIDTNGISFATFGTYNSDDFFDAAGLPERKEHNALEDIMFTVESVRRARMIFNLGMDG